MPDESAPSAALPSQARKIGGAENAPRGRSIGVESLQFGTYEGNSAASRRAPDLHRWGWQIATQGGDKSRKKDVQNITQTVSNRPKAKSKPTAAGAAESSRLWKSRPGRFRKKTKSLAKERQKPEGNNCYPTAAPLRHCSPPG